MSVNKKNDRRGFVYSTDPDFSWEEESPAGPDTLEPVRQSLRIRLDTKQRAGKAVTLVEGFTGKSQDLEELGKKLKAVCGVGGSVKEGVVIVQGDQRDKILQWLLKNNYKLAKKV